MEAQTGDWQFLCTCALTKLEDVCRRIISGDILVKELKTISLKESQMSKLCDAAARPSEQKNSGKKSTQAGGFPHYDSIKMHLDIRLKELDHFMTYRAQLKSFLHICETVALSGEALIHVCFNDACMV